MLSVDILCRYSFRHLFAASDAFIVIATILCKELSSWQWNISRWPCICSAFKGMTHPRIEILPDEIPAWSKSKKHPVIFWKRMHCELWDEGFHYSLEPSILVDKSETDEASLDAGGMEKHVTVITFKWLIQTRHTEYRYLKWRFVETIVVIKTKPRKPWNMARC